MNSKLTSSVEDFIFLSGYDMFKTMKLSIPSPDSIGKNAISAVSYEFIGEPISDRISDKFMSNYKVESKILGQIVMIPIGFKLSDWLLGGSSGSTKDLFMKSIASAGAQYIYKMLM